VGIAMFGPSIYGLVYDGHQGRRRNLWGTIFGFIVIVGGALFQ
jgi:hypothetical protein